MALMVAFTMISSSSLCFLIFLWHHSVSILLMSIADVSSRSFPVEMLSSNSLLFLAVTTMLPIFVFPVMFLFFPILPSLVLTHHFVIVSPFLLGIAKSSTLSGFGGTMRICPSSCPAHPHTCLTFAPVPSASYLINPSLVRISLRTPTFVSSLQPVS